MTIHAPELLLYNMWIVNFFKYRTIKLSRHPVKAQQMPWRLLIINAKRKRIALTWKENFDRIVGVSAFCKKMQLGKRWLFEKLEFGYVFRNGHIAVPFFYEELFEHLVGIT